MGEGWKRAVAATKATRKPSVIKGRDATSQLYRAVERYVTEKGGSVLVIGGIEIQSMANPSFNFKLAIQCTGKLPSVAAK